MTTRRSLSIEEVKDLSKLDPAAIAQVADEAWPLVRDADELHDALMTLLCCRRRKAASGAVTSINSVRAGRAAVRHIGRRHELRIAAERWPLVRAVYPRRSVQAKARIAGRH